MSKRGRKPNYQKWYENYQKNLKKNYEGIFTIVTKGPNGYTTFYGQPRLSLKKFIEAINSNYSNQKIKEAVSNFTLDVAMSQTKFISEKVRQYINIYYNTKILSGRALEFQNKLQAILGPRPNRRDLFDAYREKKPIAIEIEILREEYKDVFNYKKEYYIQ